MFDALKFTRIAATVPNAPLSRETGHYLKMGQVMEVTGLSRFLITKELGESPDTFRLPGDPESRGASCRRISSSSLEMFMRRRGMPLDRFHTLMDQMDAEHPVTIPENWRVLRTTEVARILHVSHPTALKLITEGEFPGSFIAGYDDQRIPRESVLHFQQKHQLPDLLAQWERQVANLLADEAEREMYQTSSEPVAEAA